MADLPDPSTLTDEELDNFLETGNLPEPEVEEPKPDEPKPEDKESEEHPEDKPEADKDKEEPEAVKPENPEKTPKETPEPKPADDDKDKKPSRREAARVRDLLEKYGQPDDKPEKPAVKTTGIDYSEELDADPELIKRLDADRQAAADSGYDRGLEQAKSIQFLTRLEIDAPRVEAKYPQLDKNSEEFKEQAANDVNTMYLTLVGYNPKTKAVRDADMRYGDFVDTIFTLANDLAEVKAEKQIREVKKQVAQTGLRPDGSGANKMNLNKAPEDMTDAELDEYLKQAIPQR